MKPTHEIMENNFHRVASANSVVSVQSGNRKKVASFLRKKVEEPLLRSGNSTLENLSCTVTRHAEATATAASTYYRQKKIFFSRSMGSWNGGRERKPKPIYETTTAEISTEDTSLLLSSTFSIPNKF